MGTGAIVELQPPYPPVDYRLYNTSWYNDSKDGKTRTFVFTGATSSPSDGRATNQGVVVVRVARMSVQDDHVFIDIVESSQYLTPTKSGAVRVVAANGERLTLKSSNGNTFYFDVPSRQFVSSPSTTSGP